MGAALDNKRNSRSLVGRRVLVVGLGKTGLSVARYLATYCAEVTVTDSRSAPPGLEQLRREMPEVRLALGDFSPRAFEEAELLVVSPGVSLRQPLVAQALARGVEAVGDIELFAREANAPVIAITGSNGKSTVTALMGEMARRAGRNVGVGGNIGTPALELLADGERDLYILELSSFQMETTHSLRAAAATVLNISADHMDRYESVEEYAAAKGRIFDGAACCVVNSDEPFTPRLAHGCAARIPFTLGTPDGSGYGVLRRTDGEWLARGGETLMAVSEMRLVGRHNLANALAALALGEAVGLPMAAMLATLRRFPGLDHRCQWVAEKDGVVFYNDSKGTNVGATLAAIQGLPGQVVLIAGGDGKGADFSPLRAAVAEKARAVVLIGADAPRLRAALEGAAPLVDGGDMDDAVARAAALARPGDAVLLSPACASFDMFRNFEHRGEVFAAAARRVCA